MKDTVKYVVGVEETDVSEFISLINKKFELGWNTVITSFLVPENIIVKNLDEEKGVEEFDFTKSKKVIEKDGKKYGRLSLDNYDDEPMILDYWFNNYEINIVASKNGKVNEYTFNDSWVDFVTYDIKRDYNKIKGAIIAEAYKIDVKTHSIAHKNKPEGLISSAELDIPVESDDIVETIEEDDMFSL